MKNAKCEKKNFGDHDFGVKNIFYFLIYLPKCSVFSHCTNEFELASEKEQFENHRILNAFLVVQCLFDTFLMERKKSLEKIPTEGIVDPLVIFIAPISLSSVSF